MTRRNTPRIGFIGFGEAGQAIAAGLREAGVDNISTWDILFPTKDGGKLKKTATEIGAHSISMAAAAVRLAGQLFEDLKTTRVLFVGAGEMIDLAATHFAARQPSRIVIAIATVFWSRELPRIIVGAEEFAKSMEPAASALLTATPAR